MVARLTDSPVYAHLWSTPELDALLGERARWQAWLDVLVALARVQARAGIVPDGAAEQIAFEIYALILGLHHDAGLFGFGPASARADAAFERLWRSWQA